MTTNNGSVTVQVPGLSSKVDLRLIPAEAIREQAKDKNLTKRISGPYLPVLLINEIQEFLEQREMPETVFWREAAISYLQGQDAYHMEQALDNLTMELKKKESLLLKNQQDLDDFRVRKTELEQKTQYLTQWETDLEERAQSLIKREQQIKDQARLALLDKEKLLQERELALSAREQINEAREKLLQEKEVFWSVMYEKVMAMLKPAS